MEILRLVLVLGMVFHKLVWELLKVRAGVQANRTGNTVGLKKRVLKYCKGAVLIALVFQTLVLDLFPITNESSTLRAFGLTLYSLGLATAVFGRLQLGMNWANVEDYQVLPQQSLVKSGIYGFIRHPIYTGDLLLLIGLELALNSWLVLAVILPLVVVAKQATAEESLLSQRFAEYKDYCKQTKRFIPFVV